MENISRNLEQEITELEESFSTSLERVRRLEFECTAKIADMSEYTAETKRMRALKRQRTVLYRERRRDRANQMKMRVLAYLRNYDILLDLPVNNVDFEEYKEVKLLIVDIAAESIGMGDKQYSDFNELVNLYLKMRSK